MSRPKSYQDFPRDPQIDPWLKVSIKSIFFSIYENTAGGEEMAFYKQLTIETKDWTALNLNKVVGQIESNQNHNLFKKRWYPSWKWTTRPKHI